MLREGTERSIAVALGKLPLPAQAPTTRREHQGTDQPETTGRGDVSDLGLKLVPADSIAGAGKQGVVVTGIDSRGLWAERGFDLGDIILEIGGKSVKTPAELEGALSEARSTGKRTVLLRLKSGDSMRFLTAPVG